MHIFNAVAHGMKLARDDYSHNCTNSLNLMVNMRWMAHNPKLCEHLAVKDHVVLVQGCGTSCPYLVNIPAGYSC